jgi:uncharacterized protein YmfQ (DUF2313 family)
VPSKSTGYRKTGTGLEEVKEEPMTMTRAQEQQRRVTAKVKMKSGMSSFFSYCDVLAGVKATNTSCK